MWILTVEGKENDGAYAVENEDGEKTLFIFEEEDDAVRYAMLNDMADKFMPKLIPTEVEEDVAIRACEMYDYPYAIIKSSDLVLPPDYDKI